MPHRHPSESEAMTEPNRRTGMLSQEGSTTLLENRILLPGLPRESAHRLAAVSTRLLYSDGATVFLQGDPLPGVFVVVQGALRIHRTDGRGNVQAIDTLLPGTCVGEAQAFDGGVAASSARAQGRTECWIIPADAVREAAREDPDVALCFIRNLSEQGAPSPLPGGVPGAPFVPERVGRVILEHHSLNPCRTVVEFRETQENLAQRIGASRECFSRALRSLTDAGMIQNTFPVVRILDQPRLHRFAGVDRTTFSYGTGFTGAPAANLPPHWAARPVRLPGELGA